MEFRKFSYRGVTYGSNERMSEKKVPNVDFVDETLDPTSIDDLLLSLSVCHTVVTEDNPDGSIVYNASSPD